MSNSNGSPVTSVPTKSISENQSQTNPEFDPNDPANNRYKADLDKIQANAAFGVNMLDLMKAKSSGARDYVKEVQFSIRRQYFTPKQTMTAAILMFIVGLAIGSICVAAMTDGGLPEASVLFLAIFSISFGTMLLIGNHFEKRTIKTCSRETLDEKKEEDKAFIESFTLFNT